MFKTKKFHSIATSKYKLL